MSENEPVDLCRMNQIVICTRTSKHADVIYFIMTDVNTYSGKKEGEYSETYYK